jgi:hypothetical protein
MNLQVGTAQNLIREQLTDAYERQPGILTGAFLPSSEHMAIARFKEE